ncbi:ferric-dicitrate binding protein FerR (iron transport regulator) [Rhodoblastus sphagnicola]|uniref:FecR/PupR family sigma factor regulator n=1 Tax=Rhodoblastus sphagnicola TaxID=333368 RepID=UPI001304C8C5|nr:DUF4880 domain-containing protein [Rhodoblastus sphagnicola]MBB4198907.1 ferric-dicitrate binding protein FerR (iron transport regulator) [Rhodoblastus sphagnicola]
MTRQDDHDARLANEAHDWIARVVAGEATTVDAEDFRRWRYRDADHAAAFTVAAKRWRKLGLGLRVAIDPASMAWECYGGVPKGRNSARKSARTSSRPPPMRLNDEVTMVHAGA